MGEVFVVASNEPEPSEVEGVEPYVDVSLSGEYFFLYPEILALQRQTGQLIDPQKDAFFGGPALDALEGFVAVCRARALEQPASWEQRVGKEAPSGDVVYRSTSQADVLNFLDQVTLAVQAAREANKGVFVLGE